MSEFYNAAKEKLDAGLNAKLDRYGEAMKQAVHDALLNFIAQDEEFAQAVAQGGDFKDAMAAVVKEIKNGSIPDEKAYGAAVRFYFPGATLEVSMKINLVGDAAQDEPEEINENKGAIIIDISDFF